VLDGPGQGHPWPHNPFGLWGLHATYSLTSTRAWRAVASSIFSHRSSMMDSSNCSGRILTNWISGIFPSRTCVRYRMVCFTDSIVCTSCGRRLLVMSERRSWVMSGFIVIPFLIVYTSVSEEVQCFFNKKNKKQYPCQTQIFLRLDVIELDTRPGAALAPQPFRAVGVRWGASPFRSTRSATPKRSRGTDLPYRTGRQAR
jgi:hypothetical protein